jgi:hypothetical protein
MMAGPGAEWLPMTRLALTVVFAVAALVLAGEARAELRREAIATGEALPVATPVRAETPDAATADAPATATSPKPTAARTPQTRSGAATPAAPDWRALIPGSLR